LLKPTPRRPQRPLTAKGKERTRATTSATTSPTPRVAGASYSRRHATAAARTIRATMPSVALVPWPGARASRPDTARIAAKPTAPSSQHHSRRPASEKIARPTRSEASRIKAAEA
jgi:hypothetical protein